MLEYNLHNKPFLLNHNTSVRLTWNNPALNNKEFPGDKGMGIDIPVNEVNRMLLGNPERFEKLVSKSEREFPGFEIRFKRKLLMSGTLIIKKASSKAYSGWLRSNLGNMGAEHREKYIYDIDAFDKDIDFDNKNDYDHLTEPYACPVIINNKFFYDKGRTISVDTQLPNPDWYFGSNLPEFHTEPIDTSIYDVAFKKTALAAVNIKPADNPLPEDSCPTYKVEENLDVFVVSPMLFLNYLLDELLKDSKFFIDRNDIESHPALSKLLVYNNFDIGTFEYTKSSETTEYEVTYNINRNGTISYTQDISLITRKYPAFKYKWLLPKVKMKDFIMGLQNMLNLCFHFKHDGKVDIIDREIILQTQAFDLQNYFIGQWTNDERKDITLKFLFEHDEDDTAFQEFWEDIDDRRSAENEPVDDWSDLEAITEPEIGEIRYIRNEDIYVEYALVEISTNDQAAGNDQVDDKIGWKLLSYGFQNAFYNKGFDEKELKTVFSTLWRANHGSITADQPGNMRGKQFAYQNFTPRLLFYTGNNTCNNYDLNNNIMLDWEKKDVGLIDKRYKRWAKFLSLSKPAERTAQLPYGVLDYVIRNIPFPFRCREGEFIIDKVQTTIHANYIGKSTLTVLKI